MFVAPFTYTPQRFMTDTYLTILLALVFSTLLTAQATVDASAAPAPGSEWSVELVSVDLTTRALPALGTTGVAFDFRGSLAPNGMQVDYPIQELPTEEELADGVELPNFPPGTVVGINRLAELIVSFGGPVAEFFEVRNAVVYRTGVGILEAGEYVQIDLDTAATAQPVLPLNLDTVGDSVSFAYRRVAGTDTIADRRSFRYVYAGSLVLDTLTYPEVAVYLVADSSRVADGPDGETGGELSLQFYRPGSFQPLLNLQLEELPNADGSLTAEELSGFYFAPQRLSALVDRRPAPLDFSVFPNPVSQRLVVRLGTRAGGAVAATLLTAEGRTVLRQTYSATATERDLFLDLPAGLPTGTYVLRVVQRNGRLAGSQVVTVRQ